MIRIRTSTLESYRRCIETEWGDEKELCERIRFGQWNEGPSTWQMRAGSTFHRALALEPADEVLEENGIVGLRFGEYLFNSEHIQAAIAHVGPGIREITRRREFTVNGRTVEIEGTADYVKGLLIRDYKTKFDSPSPEDYEPSLQWRFYMAIHEAACFQYDCFQFWEPKNQVGYCDMRDLISFRFWRYPNLQADCLRWLQRFLGWAEGRNLIQYLAPERKAA